MVLQTTENLILSSPLCCLILDLNFDVNWSRFWVSCFKLSICKKNHIICKCSYQPVTSVIISNNIRHWGWVGVEQNNAIMMLWWKYSDYAVFRQMDILMSGEKTLQKLKGDRKWEGGRGGCTCRERWIIQGTQGWVMEFSLIKTGLINHSMHGWSGDVFYWECWNGFILITITADNFPFDGCGSLGPSTLSALLRQWVKNDNSDQL